MYINRSSGINPVFTFMVTGWNGPEEFRALCDLSAWHGWPNTEQDFPKDFVHSHKGRGGTGSNSDEPKEKDNFLLQVCSTVSWWERKHFLKIMSPPASLKAYLHSACVFLMIALLYRGQRWHAAGKKTTTKNCSKCPEELLRSKPK